MISNFDDFYAAIKASDYSMDASNLSMAEQTILKVLVSTGTDDDLSGAVRVLENYYGVSIPRECLVEILQADLNLAMETFTKGIGDTCQRELLMSALLKKIGAPEWPCYGDGHDAYTNFMEILPSYLEKVGGKLVQ